MSKTLQLKIITALQDRLSEPLKRLRGETGQSAQSVKELRDRLKGLETAQKSLGEASQLRTSLDGTRQSLLQVREQTQRVASAMSAAQTKMLPLQRTFEQAKAKGDALSATYKEHKDRLHLARYELEQAKQRQAELANQMEQVGRALDKNSGQTDVMRRRYGSLSAAMHAQAAKVERMKVSNEELAKQTNLAGKAAGQHGRQLKGLAVMHRRASKPVNDLAKELQSLQAQEGRLQGTRREHLQRLGSLRQSLRSAGLSTHAMGDAEQALRSRVSQTTDALQAQQKALARAAEQQRKLNQAKAQYDKGKAITGNIAMTGAASMATGSAALYAGGRFLAPGMEFESTMSRVQALTRLDKGDEQLAALRAQARKLGAETMFSAVDAGKGQEFLAMAGFTPKAIMAAMPGLLDMAKAGNTELARTADIASNILGGFRIDPSEMGRVADILTKAFTTSNTSLEMLGETMKYVGPVASAAGMGLEEAAAMAGLLGNVGIQSSQAGTAMRAMILRLSAPVGPAAKALKTLGIQAKDAQGNVRSLPAVMAEVAVAVEKFGSGKRLEYLKAIFGEEPAAGMAELINQAGSGGITKQLEVVHDHFNEANRTAKVMADNLTGDLDELFSGLDEVRIELFDQQNPAMREFVKGLTDLVGQLGAWIRANPELTGMLVRTAAIMAAVAAGFGALAITIASILGPLVMMRYAFALVGIKGAGLFGMLSRMAPAATAATGQLWAVLRAGAGMAMAAMGKATMLLATGLKVLGNVLLVAGRSALFLGKALLLNPMTWIVLAIAGAAYLLWKYWEPLGQLFSDLWAGISSTTQAAWNGLVGYFQGLWARLSGLFTDGIAAVARVWRSWSPLSDIYQSIVAALGQLGSTLPAQFAAFGANLMQGLVSGIRNMAGAVKDSVVGMGDSVTGWFREKLGIHSPSRVFAGFGRNISEGAALGITDAAGLVTTATKQLAAGALSIATALPALPAQAAHLVQPVPLRFDTRPSIQATAGAAAGAHGASSATLPGIVIEGDRVEIIVQQQAGMSSTDLARAIALELDRRESQKLARARSALADYGK